MAQSAETAPTIEPGELTALEILHSTGVRVAAELDLDTLVQTVVDAGVQLCGAQVGALFYTAIDAEGRSELVYVLSGADRAAFAHFGMPRVTAMLAPTFLGERTVRSGDVLCDSRYGGNAPHQGMPAGHLAVRSYLAVPVISRSGEVLGGLFFGHAEPDVFSARSERLMTGLAAHAAVGIDNARLFQTAERLRATLEQRVEARTAERDRLWALSEDLLVLADYHGRLLRVSPSWTRVLGHDEASLLNRPYRDLLHPDDLPAAGERLATLQTGGRSISYELRLRAADGDWRWISWRLSPDPDGEHLHGIGRDVTERRARERALAEAEERLRQAQKMETVGQLTGGVAHDFNNLLQVVTGNLDILLRNLPPDAARLRRLAEGAMTGAGRAAVLTQRLLAFSRRQPLDPKPIEVNRLVAAMSELLHRTLGETIEIQTVLARDLWRAEADPNQLENALLNLAVNARDAMAGGGKLVIETRNADLEQADAAQSLEVTPGQYVVVTVSDTGAGMSPATVSRVFEPFFTTKEVGKGTGLGLSMVYGFVKQSGGDVKIYSELGRGTTVNLYLPRLPQSAGGAVEAAQAEDAPPPPQGAPDETILVCEDDEGVRAYSVEVLRELGYHVLEAADGACALAVLQGGERIDLLFTDIVLPGGMTGAALAAAAAQLRPRLRVLFTTGYARDALAHHGRLDPGVELITKPFAYAELASRVRDRLDAPIK